MAAIKSGDQRSPLLLYYGFIFAFVPFRGTGIAIITMNSRPVLSPATGTLPAIIKCFLFSLR